MDHRRVDYISEVMWNIYLIFYRISSDVQFLLYKNWLKADRVTDLLIELNVSEYGVNAPRLAEHGAERQREPDAEHPNLQLHTQRR